MQLAGTIPFEHRVTDEHQDDYARHMKTHMPVIDRHASARCHIVISREKNREKEGKPDQPRSNCPDLKTGVVLLLKLFGLFDIELRHQQPPPYRFRTSEKRTEAGIRLPPFRLTATSQLIS